MKKPSSFAILILAILAGAAMIAGALIYTRGPQGGGTHTSASPSWPTPHPLAEQLTVPGDMTSCATGESCIVVDTTCSFCCKYVAINAKAEQSFNAMFDQSCARYSGTTCECFDLGSYPKCVEGKCSLVKWEDEKKETP